MSISKDELNLAKQLYKQLCETTIVSEGNDIDKLISKLYKNLAKFQKTQAQLIKKLSKTSESDDIGQDLFDELDMIEDIGNHTIEAFTGELDTSYYTRAEMKVPNQTDLEAEDILPILYGRLEQFSKLQAKEVSKYTNSKDINQDLYDELEGSNLQKYTLTAFLGGY